MALDEIIRSVLSNFPLVLLIVALLIGLCPGAGPRADRLLRWLLLLPVGVAGLWGAFFHIARPVSAAAFIGWADSPFQFEVGMANLAIGVLGVIAFWADFGFRAAAAIANAVFLLGDAVGHVRQMANEGNTAPGNAGVVFYLDFALPVIVLTTLALAHRARREAQGA